MDALTSQRSASQSEGSVFFVLFASSVTAIGGFLFGYDTAVINGANTYLQSHFALDPRNDTFLIGLVTASAIIGCIPGAMAAGFVSDRFGRRRVLFFCAITLRDFGDPLGDSPILWPVYCGASARKRHRDWCFPLLPVCPVYIAEIAPAKWRGRLGTLFQLGIVSGIFFTLFINRWIQHSGDAAWNTGSRLALRCWQPKAAPRRLFF